MTAPRNPPDARRRVRATLRCLHDLEIAVPPLTTSLDELEHPVLKKATELATAHPDNQIRIQAIGDAMVFRFTHGRFRVITWLDADANILWLCAADIRRENEGYDGFVGRHLRGELLPDDRDARRLEDEAALELAHAIKDDAPGWVADAREHPNEELRFVLPGGAVIRLYHDPSDGAEAIWAAIPTLLANELGLPDRVRGLVVAAITEALGGASASVEFEQRHDWPTGQLPNFEMAFFWLN